MAETRSQTARREAERNNGEENVLAEASLESSFRDELLRMVREQQGLLVEYKEQQERQMLKLVEKLNDDLHQLSLHFERLCDKNTESERLIAELQAKVQRLDREMEVSQDRLVKVYAGMLASSHEILKSELQNELSFALDKHIPHTTMDRDMTSIENNKRIQSDLSPPIKATKPVSTLVFPKTNQPNKAETCPDEEDRPPTHFSKTSFARPVLQKPATFDGRTSWEAYYTQFEIVAQINIWQEAEKAAFLAASLKGQALTVLSNLPPESRADYQSLVAALESRFGNRRQAELHRMKLRNRTRRRDESLPELAEDIERLVRLAYPEASATVLETLTKDLFVDALPDDDLRLRVAQARPHCRNWNPSAWQHSGERDP